MTKILGTWPKKKSFNEGIFNVKLIEQPFFSFTCQNQRNRGIFFIRSFESFFQRPWDTIDFASKTACPNDKTS